MPERFRAGVIGCGFFAANHLHAWRQIEDVDLVAVCDLDRSKAEAAAATHGVASVYDDAEAMLASEKLDFVDIVTTMQTHRKVAELAASQRVPMIVQKPFAPTIEDCRAIVDAAAASAVPLMVHENFRFQTPINAVREVLESGVIGRPFFGRIAWRTAFDVYANQPYLAEEERFLLLDLVIHLFDVDRYLFGEVDQLTCRTQSIKPGIKGEDSATILLGHEHGVTSIIDATYSSRREPDPFPQTLIEVDGTEGSVRLNHGFELVVVSPSGTDRRSVEPVVLDWAQKPWHAIHESVLRTQEHWIECLRAGREPDTSGADNLKTYALSEASYASAASGQTVDPRTFI
ncbi:MAG: Gfo/Idh/MocA family oxidoreductase [Pseudomonadota bacterium]